MVFKHRLFARERIEVAIDGAGESLDYDANYLVFGNMVMTNSGNVDATISLIFLEVQTANIVERLEDSGQSRNLDEIYPQRKYGAFVRPLVVEKNGGHLGGTFVFGIEHQDLWDDFNPTAIAKTLVIQTNSNKRFRFSLLSYPYQFIVLPLES